jgi:hypothetical protein
MTSSLIEIGRNRQVILWQPHLLSDVLRAQRTSVLMDEPVLRPPGDAAVLPFKVTADEKRLAWSWGEWKSLEITTFHERSKGDVLKYFPSQQPEVEWRTLPACDAVELAFYDAGDQLCGEVKVGAPSVNTFGRNVSFSQPYRRAVAVKLLNNLDSANVFIELWEPGMTPARRRESFPFEKKRTDILVLIERWAGIIAVVKRQTGRPQLLGYVNYNGERLMTPNLHSALGSAELLNIRRWIGEDSAHSQRREQEALTLDEWLDNWPQTTRSNLHYLAEQAHARLGMSPASVERMLRAAPAGLSRYLSLSLCGYKAPSPEQSIRRLNEDSFETSLGALLPRLATTLATLVSPEEKDWAVKHANSPWLEAASAWGGGEGTGGLNRALHLLEKRAEAVEAWEARSHRRTSSSVPS